MMSGRFRLAGTSLHLLMVISIPDNALAIVETSTWGLWGHALLIVAFSSWADRRQLLHQHDEEVAHFRV